MTCKDCIGYPFCSRGRNGLTNYYGKDVACNSVEYLCNDFKNKADFVEVVRCEKCRYCSKTKEYDFCTNKHNFIDRKALLVYPKHFCSYGERRDI